MENCVLQSVFVAVSQSHQVIDPPHYRHPTAIISLYNALCAGQAQYRNLVSVERYGQQCSGFWK